MATMDDITTDTIYDGSANCKKCGALMSPLEVLYCDGNICAACRNQNYEKHMKRAMSDR